MSFTNPKAPMNPDSTNALVRASLHDRALGAIIGSALGDAIGLYTEFLSAAQAAEAYPLRIFTLEGPNPTGFKLDSHRSPKEPGQWTDDTDHALLLLLAFLHTARTPPPTASADEEATAANTTTDTTCNPLPTQRDLAARLRVWVQQGLRVLDTMPLGLGRLVGTVVATKDFLQEPARVAREQWERTGRRVAPNGSLMRTHPLGLMCLFRSEEETFQAAAELSRTTHFDPRCVVACAIGTGLVRSVARGEVRTEEDVDTLIDRAVAWWQGDDSGGAAGGLELDVEELHRHVRAENLDALKLDDAQAIGYVYKTLGSGVVLLRLALRRTAETRGGLLAHTKMFEELITDLIMCGGDADTNACFAGALLGAYLGYKALPDHWKHDLQHGEWLVEKAEALCQVLGLKDGSYDGQQDKDTHLDGGKGMITQQEMEGRWMVLQQTAFKRMDEAKAEASAKAASSGFGWSLPWQGKPKRGSRAG